MAHQDPVRLILRLRVRFWDVVQHRKSLPKLANAKGELTEFHEEAKACMFFFNFTS